MKKNAPKKIAKIKSKHKVNRTRLVKEMSGEIKEKYQETTFLKERNNVLLKEKKTPVCIMVIQYQLAESLLSRQNR